MTKPPLAALVAMIVSIGCAAAPRRPAALVVLAPRAYEATLTEFMAYRDRDVSAEFVPIERVLEEGSGADDAEKLKRFLFGRWLEGDLRYALLVGDADVLPVRFMCLDRWTPAAANVAFYPSDLYYADLCDRLGRFDDWNGRKDGIHGSYFGEVRGETHKDGPVNFDGVSYVPEIAVGRWPVSSPAGAAALAAKTIAYERTLDARVEPRRALFVRVDGWVDTRGVMGAWEAALAGEFEPVVLASGTEAPPEAARVVSELRRGAAVVFHAGHGHDNGWEGSLGSDAIASLGNGGHLPIVLSAGCSTARFTVLPPYEPYVDVKGEEHAGTNAGEVFEAPPPAPACYQAGLYARTGFGEELVRHATSGAVAYFGCSTGSQPCGLTLLDGFVQAMTPAGDPARRLGDLWRSAIEHYVAKERLDALVPDAG